jgi:ribonuclease P protein component
MSSGVYASTEHFALHLLNTTEICRIGAVVPKRWAKRAVTRNLIKRQIYAYVMCNLQEKKSGDMVVRLKKTFSAKEYISASSIALKSNVRMELRQLFAKAIAFS